MDVSVLSAIPASGRRSRSKRPTSSAMKCWASAAEPPLPQARILPLFASAPNSRSTAVDKGWASSRELALKVSIASSKCDVMREVMSILLIISCPCSKGAAYPVQSGGLDADDVETAGRRPAPEEAPGQRRQEEVGGFCQALLLAAVYTGGSAAVLKTATIAHFDERQDAVIVRNQIDFTCFAAQVPSQHDQALGLQV